MAARRLPRSGPRSGGKRRGSLSTSGSAKRTEPAKRARARRKSQPRVAGRERGASPRRAAAKVKAKARTKSGKSKKKDTRIGKVSTAKKLAKRVTSKKSPVKSSAKKKVTAKKVAAKRPAKRKRVVSPTRGQKSAITRARLRFIELGPPPKTRVPAAQKVAYELRKESLAKSLAKSLEKAGYSGASIRARLGWITRYLETRGRVRTLILGTMIDAQTREGWYVLRGMLEERDSRFQRFIALAQREGMSRVAAVNEWFSPKML